MTLVGPGTGDGRWKITGGMSVPELSPAGSRKGSADMDDDISGGGAVLDDDAPNEDDDHHDDVTEDAIGVVEPDPDEEDTSLTVPGTGAAAAETAAAGEIQQVALRPTMLDRMRAAGISDETARQHLRRGWVRMDGTVITDPDHPAPPPASWVIQPPTHDHPER